MNLIANLRNSEKEFLKVLRVMKITFLFLLVAICGWANETTSYAQVTEIRLSAGTKTLQEVFGEIEKETEFIFFYNDNAIDLSRKVTVQKTQGSIDEILASLLENTGADYKIVDRQIVFYNVKGFKNERTAIAGLNQQKKTVTGLLTDADGNPVIGATVSIKGTTYGVTTDIDGKYILNNVSEGDVLEFRYIGYNTEEKIYKGEKTINIRMVEASVGLEDVVVIGYGQQKKESVVSSLNTISAKELSMPTRSLTNNLAGQIAGVLAVQRSGEPGKDNSEFWIRGISSFAGGTSPLVLVDGVPRNMADIGVDEIETFTVLKDAAATAVYGAEGANGVVLITSKRGTSSKLNIDVKAEFTNSTPTRFPRNLGSYDWLSTYNEAVWEDRGNPTMNFIKPFSDEVLENYRTQVDPDLYPDTDFMSLMKNNTQNGRVVLNLRGGSDKVRYFTSASFYKENGIYKSTPSEDYDANIGLERYNLRSNIDIDLTKKTLFTIDLSGQYKNAKYPGTSSDKIFSNMFYYAPYLFPLRFSDGRFADDQESNNTTRNPYNFLNETGYSRQWNVAIQSKVALKQELDFITKGLDFKLAVSFDADINSNMSRTKSPETWYVQLVDGEKQFIQKDAGQPNLSDFEGFSQKAEKKIFIETSLNYQRTFNETHDVSGLLLYMQKESHATGVGLPYRKQSFVARGSYGYKKRYLVEGSFGLTGSENFAKGHRYGIFPAVGLAWYASHEDFMKPFEDVISKLKFRVSYGITGNDNIGASSRFPYRGSLATNAGGFNLGFTPGAGGGGSNGWGNGIVEDLFESPFLSWEIEKKANAGIDLGLFRGQVDLMFDVFKNRRSDILMQRKVVSDVTGFRKAPWQNFGVVTNRGLDANLVLKHSVGKTNLSVRGNFTYAKNKIEEYDEVNPKYEYMRYTGNSLGTPFLYIAEGLYSMDDFDIVTDEKTGAKEYTLKSGLPVPAALVKPGDIKYADLNNDNVIDDYDKTYKHDFYSANPEMVYGFGLNVEHRGFYAGIFFQGTAHTSMNLMGAATFIPFSNGTKSSLRVEALDHWSSNNPENMDVMYPRLHASKFSHNELPSTYWFRDASFIRLKNVEFGYIFNKKLLQKMKVSNLKIYVQGNNLAVWDKIKMWDPELGSAGSGAKYPISRTWTVGVNFGF